MKLIKKKRKNKIFKKVLLVREIYYLYNYIKDRKNYKK